MGIKDNIALQVKVSELQVQLKEAHARIADLEAMPQKIVQIHVDTPNCECKDRIVHVPVDVVRVEYVDNPAHIEMIKTLQEKLRGMNG